MAVWPASLPQGLMVGTGDQRQPAALRSEMDSGPAKQRRRFTAAIRNLSVPIILTNTQRATFDTFFITTLLEGVLPFDWVDPKDGSTVEYRFTAPVEFSLLSGGAERLWRGTLNLEILP